MTGSILNLWWLTSRGLSMVLGNHTIFPCFFPSPNPLHGFFMFSLTPQTNLHSLLPIFLSWLMNLLLSYFTIKMEEISKEHPWAPAMASSYLLTSVPIYGVPPLLLFWINIHILGNGLLLPCALDPVLFPSPTQSCSSFPHYLLTHPFFIFWWLFPIPSQTSY